MILISKSLAIKYQQFYWIQNAFNLRFWELSKRKSNTSSCTTQSRLVALKFKERVRERNTGMLWWLVAHWINESLNMRQTHWYCIKISTINVVRCTCSRTIWFVRSRCFMYYVYVCAANTYRLIVSVSSVAFQSPASSSVSMYLWVNEHDFIIFRLCVTLTQWYHHSLCSFYLLKFFEWIFVVQNLENLIISIPLVYMFKIIHREGQCCIRDKLHCEKKPTIFNSMLTKKAGKLEQRLWEKYYNPFLFTRYMYIRPPKFYINVIKNRVQFTKQ